MSAVMIRRDVHVAVDAVDVGREFVNAPADIQALFLSGMVQAETEWTDKQPWSFQCDFIAKELNAPGRIAAARLLRELVNYLENQTEQMQ